MPGQTLIRRNGKFGVAGVGGKFILQSTLGCPPCCGVCDGSPANPPNFFEDFAALDSDWIVQNGSVLSGDDPFEHISYGGQLYVESWADGNGPSYGAMWTRYIRKTLPTLDVMRCGFTVPQTLVGSPLASSACHVIGALTISPSGVPYTLGTITMRGTVGFAPNLNTVEATYGVTPFYNQSGVFVPGVALEVVLQRTSGSNYEVKAYRNGVLMATKNAGALSIDDDDGCESRFVLRVHHTNTSFGFRRLSTAVDDVFAEVISS